MPIAQPRSTRAPLTWGNTEQEALKNIREVVQMVVESLTERGQPVPEGPSDQGQVTIEPRVAITV